jgi:DNA primase
MPLAWSRLAEDMDAAAFTIAHAPPLLKRPDPWKDLAKSAASLETARKRLEKL